MELAAPRTSVCLLKFAAAATLHRSQTAFRPFRLVRREETKLVGPPLTLGHDKCRSTASAEAVAQPYRSEILDKVAATPDQADLRRHGI